MGNKKNSIWVLELFTTPQKLEMLKVYEFRTINDIAYVLDMQASVISNFYHKLIQPRGLLHYVNIYQQPIKVQNVFKCV